MSPTHRSWFGFTNAEVAEILKRESPGFQAEQKELEEQQGGEGWEQFKRKVATEAQADAERRATDTATLDAMSPRQYAEHLEQRKSAPPLPYPQLPTRYMLALDDTRRDRRKAEIAEQEAAEQRAGIPRMQAASADRCEKIRNQAAAELAALDQRREAVRERRERKLSDEEERCRAEVAAARAKLQEAPA